MIVGFTGTRSGMTRAQMQVVESYLLTPGYADEAHHGDCLGADAQFHNIAKGWGIRTVSHPPDDPSERAYCDATVVLPERPLLARNRDIVEMCTLLLVAPRGYKEMRRGSGTWATKRYAETRGCPLVIVFPDGTATPLPPQWPPASPVLPGKAAEAVKRERPKRT